MSIRNSDSPRSSSEVSPDDQGQNSSPSSDSASSPPSSGESPEISHLSVFNQYHPKLTLDDLPDEMIIRIFRFLAPPGASSFSRTSRRYQVVSLDFSLPNYKKTARPILNSTGSSPHLDSEELLKQASLSIKGLIFLGRHIEISMCLALIAAILLFMLFYGLGPDSGISWLTIGIPVFWVIPVAFSVLNVDGLFDPTLPSFRTSAFAPRALMPIYIFCARKRRAIKGAIIASLLVTLTALLLVIRAMTSPPFNWWLAALPLDLLCLIAPLFFFESLGRDTAKRVTIYSLLLMVSFVFLSLKLDNVFLDIPFLDFYFFIPTFLLQVVAFGWLIITLKKRPRVLAIVLVILFVILPAYLFEISFVISLSVTTGFNWHFSFLPLMVLAVTLTSWCLWINVRRPEEE